MKTFHHDLNMYTWNQTGFILSTEHDIFYAATYLIKFSNGESEKKEREWGKEKKWRLALTVFSSSGPADLHL